MVVYHTKVRDHIYPVHARGLPADSNLTGQWDVRMLTEESDTHIVAGRHIEGRSEVRTPVHVDF